MPGVLFWSKYGPLPDPNHELFIIVGKPLQLPELKNPTHEEIDHWHQRYVEELLAMYDRHK